MSYFHKHNFPYAWSFSYTRTAGKDAFTVEISSEDKSRVRVWKEILDRKDGTYIVRYRLYNTLRNLKISVFYNGNHVGKSPVILKG